MPYLSTYTIEKSDGSIVTIEGVVVGTDNKEVLTTDIFYINRAVRGWSKKDLNKIKVIDVKITKNL